MGDAAAGSSVAVASVSLQECGSTDPHHSGVPTWTCAIMAAALPNPYSSTVHALSDHGVAPEYGDVLIQGRWLQRRYYDW